MVVRRLLAMGVVGAVLLSLVAAAFLLVVLLLGRRPSDGEWTVLALSLAAAIASTLAWPVVQRRASALARRLVWGGRGAPDDVVRSFSARLTRAIPLDELLLQLAESLRASLDLEAAEVWTGSDGRLTRTASDPERGPARIELSAEEEAVVARTGVSGEAWAAVWLPALTGTHPPVLRIAPIAHAGALLGLLVASRPAGGRAFGGEDDRVLGELARHAGAVLHSAKLDSALQATLDELRRQAEELHASRARVVAAADAERRRIERDLHDGAQQRLVALAVQQRVARDLIDSDPDAARIALQELERGLGEAIDELRDLAHGIYPPLLAEQGLRDALVAAVRRAPIATQVDANGLGRYTAAVEVAVYFCVLEALQNAAKHAGAEARATVSVREEEGMLAFDVADDGCGFDPRAARHGAGLTSIADRLGAIGGRLRVDSVLGEGTRLTGRIPL